MLVPSVEIWGIGGNELVPKNWWVSMKLNPLTQIDQR